MSFPPDVVVLDAESLLHARFRRGRANPHISRLTTIPIAPNTFAPLPVTPALQNEPAFTDAIRRLTAEAGRPGRISLLLPDSWFRIHLNDIENLPDRPDEATEMVRWTLRRSLPMRPEDLRIAFQTLTRLNGTVKVLILAAVDRTLSAVEAAFRENGIEVSLIEPVGLNIWNALVVRDAASTGDRLFFYIRRSDFTTAVFRGATPLFIRSRNLSGERTLLQEIRLSASYLKNTVQWQQVTQCFVATNEADQTLLEALSQEFSAPVTRVALNEFAGWSSSVDVRGKEAELTACTGVFTA